MKPKGKRFAIATTALGLTAIFVTGYVLNDPMVPGHRGRNIAFLIVGAVVVVLAVTAWRAWPHLRFWWRFEALGKNAQGYPEYRHRQTGIVFVRIPAGSFLIGSPTRPGHITMEEPQHQVSLSAYMMGKYEVTQAQWKRFMGSNPSRFRGDSLPVHGVSWDECQEFCIKTGLKLPTEARWEYSCRAGDREWTYKARPGFQGRIPDVPNPTGEGLGGLTIDEVARNLWL